MTATATITPDKPIAPQSDKCQVRIPHIGEVVHFYHRSSAQTIIPALVMSANDYGRCTLRLFLPGTPHFKELPGICHASDPRVADRPQDYTKDDTGVWKHAPASVSIDDLVHHILNTMGGEESLLSQLAEIANKRKR